MFMDWKTNQFAKWYMDSNAVPTKVPSVLFLWSFTRWFWNLYGNVKGQEEQIQYYRKKQVCNTSWTLLGSVIIRQCYWHKDKQIWWWKRFWESRNRSCICRHWFMIRVILQSKKEWCWGNWVSVWKKKKKLDLYFISHTKIKSRCAVYLNDKCKTKKLWEDKMGQCLHDFENKESFLYGP